MTMPHKRKPKIDCDEVVPYNNDAKVLKLEGHVGELRAKCEQYEQRISLLEKILVFVDIEKLLQSIHSDAQPLVAAVDGCLWPVCRTPDASTVCPSNSSSPCIQTSEISIAKLCAEHVSISEDVVVPVTLDLQFQFDLQLSALSDKIEALQKNICRNDRSFKTHVEMRLNHKLYGKDGFEEQMRDELRHVMWCIFLVASELGIDVDDLGSEAERMISELENPVGD